MTNKDLKAWMKANGKSATDVASMVHVSLRTVERFLDGHHEVRPIVLAAFNRLVDKDYDDAS